ncbi:hypothetical protein C1645_781364 [Glomus cerebriforme]|uniref:Uncharacterized protein n=1 Tax=Glomus cerebriforme TaxID=658196 RepID=A0A397SNN0_9GLOM|nr:hypothetical protein C1645_781364 [Glomus cerebriforme]
MLKAWSRNGNSKQTVLWELIIRAMPKAWSRNGNLKQTVLRNHLFVLRQKQTVLRKSFIRAASKVWSRNTKYEFEANRTAGVDYLCYAESLVNSKRIMLQESISCAVLKVWPQNTNSKRTILWESIVCTVPKVWSQNTKYEFEANPIARIIYSCCAKSLVLNTNLKQTVLQGSIGFLFLIINYLIYLLLNDLIFFKIIILLIIFIFYYPSRFDYNKYENRIPFGYWGLRVNLLRSKVGLFYLFIKYYWLIIIEYFFLFLLF